MDVYFDDQELQREMQKLTARLGKKTITSAMRSGAGVILKEAKQLVPEKTGALKKSLKIRQRGTFEGLEVSVGSSWPSAHLVEFGTQPHMVGARKHPGAKPKPFLRPAFRNKHSEALSKIKNRLRDAVERGLK